MVDAVRSEWPLVEVAGSAYDMGYEHGVQASELVERYLFWIERMTGRSRDELCRNAMAFLPLMERLSSAYIEEIRGLSEGAKISFDEAVLCQARGEAARVDVVEVEVPQKT